MKPIYVYRIAVVASVQSRLSLDIRQEKNFYNSFPLPQRVWQKLKNRNDDGDDGQ